MHVRLLQQGLAYWLKTTWVGILQTERPDRTAEPKSKGSGSLAATITYAQMEVMETAIKPTFLPHRSDTHPNSGPEKMRTAPTAAQKMPATSSG